MTFSHSTSAPPDKTPAFDIRLGLRVKAFRQRNRQSQQDIAKAVGISYQHLQKYERGASRMKVSLLLKIADALDVSILAFIPDTGKRAILDVEGPQLRDLLARLPLELRDEVKASVASWEQGA